MLGQLCGQAAHHGGPVAFHRRWPRRSLATFLEVLERKFTGASTGCAGSPGWARPKPSSTTESPWRCGSGAQGSCARHGGLRAARHRQDPRGAPWATPEAGCVLFAPACLVQELLAAKLDLDLPRQLASCNGSSTTWATCPRAPRNRRSSSPSRRTLSGHHVKPASEWERIFANPMATAAAIGVVHHSVILEFDGYRTNAAQQRGQAKEVNRQNCDANRQIYAGHAVHAERYRREHGEKATRATALGQAISYRFKRDGKGWRVFVSNQMMDVPVVTDRRRGAIGVDLNADHLAVADTDASGNCLKAWRVPLVTYGKSQHQAEALIGDAVASVVQYAREVGKPIVIERLDFRQKKAVLEGESHRYSRMLSSFSYGKIKAYFVSRGYRQGVEIHQVNPAYSSVIGRVKFMERYGLTVHQAAALVLARRLLGCSERIPRRWVCPVGNGVQVAFTVPVRKRVKHVWTYWGAVSGQLRPALAAQHRLGKRRRQPNPVQAVRRAQARGVA